MEENFSNFLVSTNKSSPFGEIVTEIKHMRTKELEPEFFGSDPERARALGAGMYFKG